jgi:hypothetical protein
MKDISQNSQISDNRQTILTSPQTNVFSLVSNKLKVSERSSTPRIVPPLRSFSIDEINDAVNYLLDTIGQTMISPWDGHLLCTTHGLT